MEGEGGVKVSRMGQSYTAPARRKGCDSIGIPTA